MNMYAGLFTMLYNFLQYIQIIFIKNILYINGGKIECWNNYKYSQVKYTWVIPESCKMSHSHIV